MYDTKKLMKDYETRDSFEKVKSFLEDLGFVLDSSEKIFKRHLFNFTECPRIKLRLTFMSTSSLDIETDGKDSLFESGVRQHIHYFRRAMIRLFGRLYSNVNERFNEAELRVFERTMMRALEFEDDSLEEVESYDKLTC